MRNDNRYVGFVDFTDRDLPLNAGLRGVARQTYDSVPIGFAFPPAGQNCPSWTVSQAAWEEAGGATAGTNGSGRTIWGELPVGEGRVRFLGALLPQPTEEFYHPYGLQNYAVTYTGYTLLRNALAYDAPRLGTVGTGGNRPRMRRPPRRARRSRRRVATSRSSRWRSPPSARWPCAGDAAARGCRGAPARARSPRTAP